MYDYLGKSFDANVSGRNHYDFVTDENVPKYVSESLMNKNYSVLSIIHKRFFGWPDELIAFFGRINNSILITCDKRMVKNFPGQAINFLYDDNLDDVICKAINMHKAVHVNE